MTDTYGNYEDWIPLNDGVWSFVPDDAITKNSPVKPTTDGSDLSGIKVSESGADDDCIGIAMEAATGDSDPKTIKVQTRFRAIVKCTAYAAVTQGKPVTPAGTDKVKAQPDINEGGTGSYSYASKIFGIALQSASADGDVIAVGLF